MSKLRSTYTEALPNYVNPTTKRVHTSYALAATSTGRLSSSEPNLQNIPIRTEDGRKIRKAFVAAPGMKLVSADYSQIELRLLSEVAEVPALRKAFQDNVDIHAMTASEMFGVPVKDMPAEVRRRAKAINFGIIYGISAFGLAAQFGIDHKEAGAYIKKYFERFPGIRDYMDETREFCRDHGYVLTLFGRKCHYPDIKNSESVDPRIQRARRHQCTPAGHGRRHHPPRHDPHRAGARQGQAEGADAVAGARRADLRGAGGRGDRHHHHRQERDGGRAAPGGRAARAAAGRRPRRRQLGRGALKRTGLLAALIVLLTQPAQAAPALDGAAMGWPWALPFVGLLLSIATGPLLFPKFWHAHYGKIAAGWALVTLLPIAAVFGAAAAFSALVHATLAEYMSFIILLFALYVTAGGIVISGSLRGTPVVNAGILAFGAAIASIVGTTGAAMILVRPLIRANSGRKYNAHVVVFFIVIVANIGGALSPLGDPPLFVGFLRGVSFFWTTTHLWLETLLTAALVLAIFVVLDALLPRSEANCGNRSPCVCTDLSTCP